MLYRLALLVATLSLAGPAASGEKTHASLSAICPVQTNWTRLLAADDAFDGPPEINAFILNVIKGRLPEVRLQLATINPADAARWRQSALIIAAYAKESAMVDGLLDDGALVDGLGTLPGIDRKSRERVVAQMKKDRQWTSVSPDEKAALERDSPIAALLFNSRFEGPVATIAAQCGDLLTLDVALKHHANLKLRIPHSNDAVAMAVHADNPVVVKRLLDHGANPTSAPPRLTDGLTTAILEGKSDMVTLLLDYGADPCTDDRRRQRRHDADQAKQPGQKKPVISDATIARRQNLPDDLVARLTCPAFDSASTAIH